MQIFRQPACPRSQRMLFPPSVDELLSSSHPARVLSEIIDGMDLSAFEARHAGGGAPAYRPGVLLKLLMYGCWLGERSSRKLAHLAEHHIAFIFLHEMDVPSYRTLSRFRRDNLEAIVGVFVETVALAQSLGIVCLRTIAVDGTKIEANVSRKNDYGADRLERELAAIEEHIKRALAEAEVCDASEDDEFGEECSGYPDGVSEELSDTMRLRERLKQARAELARSRRATVCVTDTDARVCRTRNGNLPAYNAQAAVDAGSQIILAAEVSQAENDVAELPAMLEQAASNTGTSLGCPAERLDCHARAPTVLADTGYWSHTSLGYLEEHKIDAVIPRKHGITQRTARVEASWTYDPENDTFVNAAGVTLHYVRTYRHRGKLYRQYRDRAKTQFRSVLDDGGISARMAARARSEEGKQMAKLRGSTVEPVFGHLKGCFRLRRLLLRGLDGARIEYLLACSAHNLGKIVSNRALTAA